MKAVPVSDKPDVILLDILMPKMDDPETRLSAYDAGGDDILAKPISAQVLRHKVEGALKNREMVTELHKEIADTRGMLMTSLTTAHGVGK